MALDGSGNVFVAYYDCTNRDLCIARRDGPGLWTRQVIESQDYTGQYPSLVIGDDGTLYIAYYNATLNQLRLAYGTFGHWTIEIADTRNYPGFFNVMRMDSAGRLHIGHISGAGSETRYSVRLGPNTWQNEVVAYGMYVTIAGLAIDPDDHPCVFYGDITSRLWYAHRGEKEWVKEAIETGLGSSVYPLPAFGIDGCPYVVFAEGSKESPLRLAYRPGEKWEFEPIVSRVYGTTSFYSALGANGHLGAAAISLDGGGLLYAETSIAVTAAPPVDFLNPMWNQISFPVLPVPPYTYDPASILGAEAVVNRFFRLDPIAKNVELYPADFTEFEIGRGYILWSGAETYNPTYEGLAGPNPARIAVPEQGAMWIGQPHNSATGLEAMSVQDQITGQVRTAQEDYDSPNPWLNWNFVYFDSYVDTYRISSLAGGDDDSARPWYGYRVWSFKEDLTLIVPRG